MLICKQCNGLYKCLGAYIIHFQIYHKTVAKFLCGIPDCFREFDTSKSYRKHFNKVHAKSNLPLKQTASSGANDPNSFSTDESNSVLDLIKEIEPVHFSNYTDEIRKIILKQTICFIATLYGNRSLCRKTVTGIIRSVQHFYQSLINIFQQNVGHVFDGIPNETCIKIASLFTESLQSLSRFTTEHKTLQYFKREKLFVEPKKHLVGAKFCRKKRFSKLMLKSINHYVWYVSITETMSSFFHMPEVLPRTLEYINQLRDEKHVFRNYIQGSHWNAKLNFYPKNAIVFPLFIYYDEFESGNPLGSHAGSNKLGGIYYSVPCLPPDIQSNLSNIFVAMIFRSHDLKKFGKKIVLKCLFDELNLLSTNGINIQDKIVYFQMALLLGDNLGQNGMLGLTESFIGNYCCRFCRAPKTMRQKMCTENTDYLRTERNYIEDCKNDVSNTGIKEICVWHAVSNFHLTSNLTVDFMHDVLEGVCVTDMLCVLKICLEKQLFSLETLNYRIKCFNFGFETNLPPEIKMVHLRESKLRMSAAEMLCFVRYFGVIIGDLVPEHLDVWKLYLSLRQMLDYFCSKQMLKDCAVIIRNLVEEHNQLYMELSKSHLKFKNHVLIHYARIFQNCGPFSFYSSIRFEAKHKELKTIASSISTRVDIAQSIMKRHQLSFSFNLLLKKYDSVRSVEHGPFKKVCTDNLISDFKDIKIPEALLTCKEILTCTWVRLPDIKISLNANFVLVLQNKKDQDEPIFAILKKIIYSNNEVFFLAEILGTLMFCNHLFAYKVYSTRTFRVVALKDLYNHVPCLLVEKKDLYVVCHYRI